MAASRVSHVLTPSSSVDLLRRRTHYATFIGQCSHLLSHNKPRRTLALFLQAFVTPVPLGIRGIRGTLMYRRSNCAQSRVYFVRALRAASNHGNHLWSQPGRSLADHGWSAAETLADITPSRFSWQDYQPTLPHKPLPPGDEQRT